MDNFLPCWSEVDMIEINQEISKLYDKSIRHSKSNPIIPCKLLQIGKDSHKWCHLLSKDLSGKKVQSVDTKQH
jgi:hypothetical protein